MPPIVTWILNRVDEMRAVVPKDVNQIIDAFAGRTTALDEKITSRMLAPTIIEQRCTAGTTTSGTTETDLTGATISVTPAIASVALVIGVFRVSSHTVDGDQFLGLLDVDGTNEGAAAVINATGVASRQTFTQIWLVPLTAAAHTLKLQALRNSGTGTITFGSVSSKLIVMVLGDAGAVNDASS